MKQGEIEIKYNEQGRPYNIVATFDNGEIWLTTNEIAHLLGASVRTIEARIKAIYKDEVLFESNASRFNGQVQYFNFQMIVGIAYRLSSMEAKFMRKWLLDNTKNAGILQNIDISAILSEQISGVVS